MRTNNRAGTALPSHASDETVVIGRIIDDPAPMVDGGLAAELAAAAPRRWWNRTTVALAAVVLVGSGFLGGAYVQQQYGRPAGGQQPAGGGSGGVRPGQLPAGFGPGAGQRAGGGTGRQDSAGSAAPGEGATTSGTVKLVDGGTVYVQTADGQVITVRTTGSTVVRTAKKATLEDLEPGDAVTVQGRTGDGSIVTATSVTGEPK